MSMQRLEEADQAARELVHRLGHGGAEVFLRERIERLAGTGDWSSHDAAFRTLSALERAVRAAQAR
jgi:hypothetical protein